MSLLLSLFGSWCWWLGKKRLVFCEKLCWRLKQRFSLGPWLLMNECGIGLLFFFLELNLILVLCHVLASSLQSWDLEFRNIACPRICKGGRRNHALVSRESREPIKHLQQKRPQQMFLQVLLSGFAFVKCVAASPQMRPGLASRSKFNVDYQ